MLSKHVSGELVADARHGVLGAVRLGERNEEFWVAERRLLGDAQEVHSWLVIAYAPERDAVKMQYRLNLLHMRGQEMRLLRPGGAVVQYHSGTSVACDVLVGNASARVEVPA